MTSGTCRDLDARSELEDADEQRVAIHTKTGMHKYEREMETTIE
jgi:hypothetical protein